MASNKNIKLTVDILIFSSTITSRMVLLVKRKNEPFKDQLVFPGEYKIMVKFLKHPSVVS